MTADARRPLPPSEAPRIARERMRLLYDAYSTDPRFKKMWSPDSPASRLMSERKWGLIRSVLRSEGLDLRPLRILDLGVGSGTDAGNLSRLPCPPELCVGIDLRADHVRAARRSYSWLSTVTGDSGTLPFRDRRFELVYQSTMLSSVISREDRARIFREIDRVLEPGGVFLSYDTRYPNPWNRNTRPLLLREIRSAFPGWTIKSWSLTAIPQLQRVVAPLSRKACRLLERIPALRSHLLIVASKQGARSGRPDGGVQP